MITKRFLKILLGSVVLLEVAVVVLAGLDNRRLQKRVAALRGQGQQAERLREANQHTRALLTRVQSEEDGGARVIQTELELARARIGDLERRAFETHRQMRAQTEADAASLTDNHDPEKGLTRLENCRNVGRGTPAAAFQTFVWAALKGEDGQLAGMIALEGEAREKAAAAVAALPEAARAQYDTPEKLAALFFAWALTGQSSAQIVDVTLTDFAHATVSVRGLTDKIQKVPMQLGPQGWQITVPAGMAAKLGQWAEGRQSPAAH